MTTRSRRPSPSDSAGLTLIEVMIALIVLSVGMLAIARLFPTGSRSQVASRMRTTADQYADETFENLCGLPRSNPAWSPGRHPVSGFETLGATRAWRRYYVVSSMPSPLDSLVKVQATVGWTSARRESVSITGYLLP
jgi:prepilin-type N-terminal cleavage/methylation domain-containing protein